MSNLTRKTIVIVAIQIGLALIHVFRLGQIFNGKMYDLYYGYFSDILIPFGAYFLLSINEVTLPFLRPWLMKWSLVFLVMTTSEIGQFFGIQLFGVTFDAFDIIAYAIGTSLAALVDLKIFSRYLKFWKIPDNEELHQAK